MKRSRMMRAEKAEDLFDEIWAEYYPRITVFLKTSFCFRNPEDLVQEIMLKIFTNLGNYSPAYAVSTWIYTIARNQAIDTIRKEDTVRRTRAAEADALLLSNRPPQTPETILLEKQLSLSVSEYIDKLPEDEKELAFLRYYEGLGYRDISRITGMPIGTAKYKIHRIKMKFSDYYGENYED